MKETWLKTAFIKKLQIDTDSKNVSYILVDGTTA